MPPLPPAFDARDEKRDAGLALPPALVRALELADDGGEERRLRRVGDVPDLVRRVAVLAQQIDLAPVAPGQPGAVAHLHHLRAARLILPGLAGNVGEIARALRIGHIEDGSAVGLLPAAERIARPAAVMADIRDPAIALPMDERLIGAAALQIVDAPQLHGALLDLRSGLEERASAQKEHDERPVPISHATLFSRAWRRLPSRASRILRIRCGSRRRIPRAW